MDSHPHQGRAQPPAGLRRSPPAPRSSPAMGIPTAARNARV